MLAPWKKSCDKLSIFKSTDITLPTTVCIGKAKTFPRSHVWMWELDLKEGWALKNWYFQTVVLEKTLESPLNSEEIKPVNPKENQPWLFIGRTDAEAEAPILWQSDAKCQLIGKDPYSGNLWAGGEGGDRGWDGWMTSLTQWTWRSSRKRIKMVLKILNVNENKWRG